MRNTKLITIAVLIFAFAAAVSAQKKPVFTSAYTSLGTGCKVLKGGDGQDDAKLCPGVGGYQIRIYSSATMTHLNAEKKGSDESTPLVNVGLDWNESKVKLEWRLANGKPFAVIIRVPKYADRDGESVGKKFGEELFISGLADHEFLSESVDVKTRNANVKARAVADKAYTQ